MNENTVITYAAQYLGNYQGITENPQIRDIIDIVIDGLSSLLDKLDHYRWRKCSEEVPETELGNSELLLLFFPIGLYLGSDFINYSNGVFKIGKYHKVVSEYRRKTGYYIGQRRFTFSKPQPVWWRYIDKPEEK